MQKNLHMKSFWIIIVCFLFLLSCSDSGYKTIIDFYTNNRNDFLKSGLVNENFGERGWYYQQDEKGKVIYRVLIVDSCNIIVSGDFNYFNSIYKISCDTLKNQDRIEFKLHNNDWIGVIDSTTRVTQLNKTGLEYFLDLEKLRHKWGISMIYKYNSTITIRFYDNKNELIYKGFQSPDINTERIERLDSLWTYKKLKKSYD